MSSYPILGARFILYSLLHLLLLLSPPPFILTSPLLLT